MPISPAHILVVDDNPATRYATSRVLRAAGWQVSEAESGQEAVEKSRTGVDLVVLDVNLPDFDGYEVCRRIREHDATSRLPVLHLSATFVQDVHKVHGLESGADGYLTHPIEPPVLVATVNAFLRARQAEIELRQSESRFKSVFDNAPIGVALISGDFRLLDVNPAMCGFLQRQREEVVGRAVDDFVPPDFRAVVGESRRQLEDHDAWRGMLPLARAGGQIADTEWNMSTQAAPGLRLAIVSDVTDRIKFEQERERLLLSERAAREEVEHANRLKDDFLATLSHELRTPLNSIIGWTQLARMGALDDKELGEALEIIERNGRVQADMIADLLDVSRITSGKVRLNLQAVDPAEVIDAALTAVMPTSTAKNIRIARELDREAGPVTADPVRLQQVVWNLVNNAVKFTPEEGTIQVTLARRASQIEISVRDNGIGFSSSLLPTIFDRFRQGDTGSTREHGGLGLGLAIVKQLVEMHGGTVRAESPGSGRGATFTVQLPTAGFQTARRPAPMRERTPEPLRAPEKESIDLSGVRVLVVEDDPDALQLLTRIVRDCKAEVQAESSVESALANIERFRPTVLVSDLGMPRQDGFDLIRNLRALGYSFKDLPAIALTAFARGEDRQRALMAGFQFHLAKPVEPSELVTAIAALSGRTG